MQPLIISLLTIIILTGVYSLIEPFRVQIKTIKIKTKSPIKKRIVLITDHHLGVFKNTSFVKKLAKMINSIEGVDLVIHSGDFSERLKIEDMAKVLEPLKTIKYPQYGVLGNHDFELFEKPFKKTIYSGQTNYSTALTNELENVGVKMLDHKTITTGDVVITGVYSRYNDCQELELVPPRHENKLNLTIAHEPYTAKLLKSGCTDLVLSGHTHFGQIRIPFLDALSRFVIPRDIRPVEGVLDDLDFGEYGVNDNKLFISNGVGESGLPIRLCNRPTIWVLELT
jgi:uncharacterized protein